MGNNASKTLSALAPDAFLSHSSKDDALAQSLCQLLESQGIRCWLAPRDVTPGRAYAEECVRGIEASQSFVLLASENAVASVQVMSEVEQAHKRAKTIYTILIGKPKITQELDYYISRLDWIEYAGDSVGSLAERLGKVLSGHETWSQVASPPSLRRTVLYRRDAFMGSAVATLLALVLVGGGAAYWAHHQLGKLDVDFRRLGYVVLSAQRSLDSNAKSPVIQLTAQVWLLAKNVPFRDVALTTAAGRADGGVEQSDRSPLFNPEQVGSVEIVDFPSSLQTRKLTTCLVMPNPDLHQRYRVTQVFSISTSGVSDANQLFSVSPISEPKVTQEDGSACRSGA
jgi:TIR domain